MAQENVGKFLGSFGEGFIKTLQSERERKQKELEFNQEMSYKIRQMNLMNQVYMQRQALDEAQSFVDVKKDDVYNKIGVPEGKYHTSLLDNVISAYGKSNAPEKPTDLFNNVITLPNPEDNNRPWKYGVSDKELDEKGQPKKYPIGLDTTEMRLRQQGNKTSGEDNTKLKNQYEITAFGRLKNRGTGEEDKVYTPEQMDIDFNTVANALLTPSVMSVVNGMRKGSGDYPSVNELIDGFQKAGLKGKDAQSAEDFLEYYSQIESTLAPTKVQWWK